MSERERGGGGNDHASDVMAISDVDTDFMGRNIFHCRRIPWTLKSQTSSATAMWTPGSLDRDSGASCLFGMEVSSSSSGLIWWPSLAHSAF